VFKKCWGGGGEYSNILQQINKICSWYNKVKGMRRRARGREQLPVDLKEKEKVLEIQRGSTVSQFVGNTL